MTKSTITRERLGKIKSWRETYGAGSNVMLPAEEAEELARMALAAMDSEPVAEVVSVFGDSESIGERELKLLVGIQNMPYGTKFYRHAQPAPDTEREPIAWLNDAYLARGVVDGEAGSEDAGPGYIPVYREASPAQPAPVVQENSDPRDAFEAAFPMPKHAQRCGDGYAVTSYGSWTAYEFVKKWEGWNACRAAMLQAGNSPVIPDGLIAAVNRLLDSDGSRGCYSAIRCYDARAEVERLLAAAPQEVTGE